MATPTPPEAREGSLGGDRRRREKMGLSAGRIGAPERLPRRRAGWRRGVRAARRAGEGLGAQGSPAAQPRRDAGSLTCRPLGCLLFPPWHRSTSVLSRCWRPGPEPRAGARGLARLSARPPPPARWLLGRLSASVPPTIPPATPPPRAGDPPLGRADPGGSCRLV